MLEGIFSLYNWAMKILGISDAIDSLIYSQSAPERYKDIDLVISSGDLPLRYYDYIQTVLKKDVIYVYGNHNLEDFDHAMGKTAPLMPDYKPLMPVVYQGIFADGKVIRLKKRGLLIAGLGGSMLYNYGKSQYSEREMKMRIFKLLPSLIYNKIRYGRYVDILVTHAPASSLGDGADLCHRGFKCFLWFMEKFKPKYLLHGHVHLFDMNAERIREYKDTKVINVYKSYILEDDEIGEK